MCGVITKIIVVIDRSVSEVSRFETINTHSVLTSTREFNHKILFFAFKDFVQSIVCWLERWFHGIVSDEYMRAGMKIGVYKRCKV